MGKMSMRLQGSLEQAIEKWMNGESESEDWENLDTYIAEDTARLMTIAASAILDAQASLATYLREDGHEV